MTNSEKKHKRDPKYAFQYDMELIKYCHEDRTRKQIADYRYFDGTKMSERKLSDFLNKEITYSFCGTEFKNTIKYHRNDDGKWVYVASSSGGESLDIESNREETIENFDSVNPIFLALNLSEVYLLSEYFLDLVEEHDSEMLEVCERLVSKINCQLSDYSRKRLKTKHNLSADAKELLQYESEKKYEKNIAHKLAITRKKTYQRNM